MLGFGVRTVDGSIVGWKRSVGELEAASHPRRWRTASRDRGSSGELFQGSFFVVSCLYNAKIGSQLVLVPVACYCGLVKGRLPVNRAVKRKKQRHSTPRIRTAWSTCSKRDSGSSPHERLRLWKRAAPRNAAIFAKAITGTKGPFEWHVRYLKVSG